MFRLPETQSYLRPRIINMQFGQKYLFSLHKQKHNISLGNITALKVRLNSYEM
jgi:hypothetical protein